MSSDTRLNTRLLKRYPDAYPNDDGDVIVERTGLKREPTSGDLMPTGYEVNLTKQYRPGPRTTGTVEHLVIEAELYAETGDAGNAARPIDAETEDAARSRLESKELQPAWEATVP